ncbi:DNA repair protein RadA [subsurface metagenome]
MKLDEPAVDLGIISSMMSSFLDRSIDFGTVVCGEVGLTGEVRGVGRMDERIKEASRMGFNRCILPGGTSSNDILPETKMARIKIDSIRKLPEHLF